MGHHPDEAGPLEAVGTWEAHTPEVLIVYAGGSAARHLATMPLAELYATLPAAWRTGPPPATGAVPVGVQLRWR